MTETPRQRFLRNHDENVRIMKAEAVRARQEGDETTAKRIDVMVAAWEIIADKAREEEP